MAELPPLSTVLTDALKELAHTSEATAKLMATYVEQVEAVLSSHGSLTEEGRTLLLDLQKAIVAFGESNLSFAHHMIELREVSKRIEIAVST